MKRLDEIEARWKGQGPWHLDHPSRPMLVNAVIRTDSGEAVAVGRWYNDGDNTALMAIAYAPEDVAWLIAELKEAQKGPTG